MSARDHKQEDEFWNPINIGAILQEIIDLKDRGLLGTISGGFAWHFISPPHEERRTLHDHKKLDMFVDPQQAYETIRGLKNRGYGIEWANSNKESKAHRYQRDIDAAGWRVKISIDLCIRDVPSVVTPSGFFVVRPDVLLTFHEDDETTEIQRIIHNSNDCTAARMARRLLARNIDPMGRQELIRGY